MPYKTNTADQPIATVAPPVVPAPEATNATDADIEAIVNARVNSKLASHKRTLQTQLKDAQTRATAYDTLKAQVGELLESGLIDGVENLDEFRQAAADTIDQYKSEAERLVDEGKKQSKLLADATKRADTSTSRYNLAMAKQAVTDEAATLASSPASLKFIQQELAQYANVPDDKGVVTFNMPIANEEGVPEIKTLSAKQAVAVLEANVTEFGPLFKSNVVGGSGSEIVDGLNRRQDGHIDFGNMSMEKYMELRHKNPGALDSTLANSRL